LLSMVAGHVPRGRRVKRGIMRGVGAATIWICLLVFIIFPPAGLVWALLRLVRKLFSK